VRGSHGWAEIDRERKRELIRAIAWGKATRGPSHVELDLTDRCNVACYFCNQQDVRTKEQISWEHLERLIDELAGSGLKSVRLSGGGDPLAHRDVGRVMDHLHGHGVVVDNLTTNGALLTPELAGRLVKYKAREVIFSLNAVDENDYARMMQVKPPVFHKVIANIRNLIEQRGGGDHPAVVVQFLIDRKNFRELPRMYALGRSLGPDRIAVGPVLPIPLNKIDLSWLLTPEDAETLRPLVREILLADRDKRLLQIDFSIYGWNAMLAEVRAEVGGELPSLFPTAKSFRLENGHCFFGWYTATIRGTGEMYPCCLLMQPDYKPLGNALDGSFRSQWNGPGFTRLREEMRHTFLLGEEAKYKPEIHKVVRRECVEPHLCFLKNQYFRGDEEFYADLDRAMQWARRRSKWKKTVLDLLPKPVARAADRALAFLRS
jgi:MoaA/NifB/PqqE/SkfB family radical SAM enzyme